MKKKNGFTLVEILAVIVVLSVIAMLVFPRINNNDNISRQDRKVIAMIENAAKMYYLSNDYSSVISIEELINSGNLESIGIDREKFNGYVIVTMNNGEYIYTYSDTYPTTYIITFDANGGNTINVTKEVLAGGIYGKLPVATRNGYVFDGWYTNASNGEKIEELSIANITDNQTLYAHWTQSGTPNLKDRIITLSSDSTNQIATYYYDSTRTDTTSDKAVYIDYRYYGANDDNLNNYVTFNNETWRIIGVVDGKVKLIRNESLGSMVWSNPANNTWTRPATLNTYLNGDYWYDNLTVTSRNMVDEANWYVKSFSNSDMYAKDAYKQERLGATWKGNVALMTLSDYGYASSIENCVNSKTFSNYYDTTCKNSNWIYNSSIKQWTLNAYTSDQVWYIHSDGHYYAGGSGFTNGVRPVVYLKEDVLIDAGDGSSGNPYQLKRTLTKLKDRIITLSSDSSNQIEKYMYDSEWNSVTSNGKYTDYRYYGKTPKNYVEFNNETWRIIGVVTTENAKNQTTSLVKIMKADKLVSGSTSAFSWDADGGTYGSKDWARPANLNVELNDYYWNNKSGEKWWTYSGGKKQIDVTINGLSKDAQKMVEENVTWYTTKLNAMSAVDIVYNKERMGYNTENGKLLKWKGNVGLINPSDYGYAAPKESCGGILLDSKFKSACSELDWMWKDAEWTISGLSGNGNYAWRLLDGYVSKDILVYNGQGVRPVVYLKEDVVASAGDGSSGNPYKLGI